MLVRDLLQGWLRSTAACTTSTAGRITSTTTEDHRVNAILVTDPTELSSSTAPPRPPTAAVLARSVGVPHLFLSRSRTSRTMTSRDRGTRRIEDTDSTPTPWAMGRWIQPDQQDGLSYRHYVWQSRFRANKPVVAFSTRSSRRRALKKTYLLHYRKQARRERNAGLRIERQRSSTSNQSRDDRARRRGGRSTG